MHDKQWSWIAFIVFFKVSKKIKVYRKVHRVQDIYEVSPKTAFESRTSLIFPFDKPNSLRAEFF